MSRIIVKNLPKAITEDKLRSLFSAKGQITDVQLKYTKEGQFRQFAFIGYHNENDAAQAIEYFDQSRINDSKISVQECAALGNEAKPKSWSKYAKDSSAFKKLHTNEKPPDVEEPVKEEKKKKQKKDRNKNATTELLKKYKDDALFEDFLQVHSAKKAQDLLRSAKKTETDDDDDDDADKDDVKGDINEEEEEMNEEGDDNSTEKLAKNNNISDEDYLNLLKTKAPRKKMEKKAKVKVNLFNIKLTNLPYNCNKKDIKDFFRPVVPFSIRIPRHIKGIAFVGFKDEKKFNKAMLKNKSIIKGKQILLIKYEKVDATNKADEANQKWRSQEEMLKNEEGIAESGRIFIRNLSYTTTEDDIQKMFEAFGPIAELNLPVDTTTRQMKGFGVITFVMPEHAVKAYSNLDGKILHGRMLHLLPGKPKDSADNDGDDDGTDFKKKKTKQQKAQAGSSHNWNSLFLGHDAVADVIANTYNTTKENVIGPHGSGSAAVRLALGETQIVAQTRKFLEEHGVYLDAFNDAKAKRSKTIILVKNLPANTQSKEIKHMFEEHGVIGRLIFPPSGITAIVEFLEPSEARKAFTKLAYKKFKHLPLYLEWAPENVMKFDNKSQGTVESTEPEAIKINEEKDEDENETVQVQVSNKQVESEMRIDESEEPEADTTLYVKNVNFKTTEGDLRKHFSQCGKIYSATIATKKDPNDPKRTLSMGYAFIRYLHKASADKALKLLQCSDVDGKSLDIKRSERTLQSDVKTAKKTSKLTKQTGTKILVRNVCFQANRKELYELFKTFGEIKALRLPKKMTPGSDSHRGFAFIEYTTNSDAKKAFDALSQSTHLYGRRLVLEWANAEEGVEEIRKRTADHFHQEEVVRSKKGVFGVESK